MDDRDEIVKPTPLTPQPVAHPLAVLWSLIGGALLFVFMIAGIFAAYHQFVQGARIMVIILVGLGVVLIPSSVIVGVVLMYQSHKRKTKIQELEITRAERAISREDELNRAKIAQLEAQAEVVRRTIAFDGVGNAALINEYGQVIQLRGNYQDFPNLQTYHQSSRHESALIEGPGGQGQALLQQARPLPRVELFYDQIPYNSLQTAMGIEAETGNPILAPIRQSTHFKLIGGSGQGKSCVAAAMLDIATSTNDADHLKIGLLDLEHNTSRLFEDIPHIAEIGPRRQRLIGRNAEEVAQKLKLLQWELTRRSELGEDYCKQHEPVLLVYVEEMLALKYEVVDKKLNQQMLAAINIVGVRGRKYGIFLLACMQTDYSDKSTREAMAQFRTRAGFAIDPDTARASGFFNTELVKENYQAGRPGQYVLEKPAYSGIVLSPDYDVAAKLERIGAATVPTTSAAMPALPLRPGLAQLPSPEVEQTSGIVEGVAATTTQGKPALTAQEWRIIEKWQGGMSMRAIIASEYSNGKGEPLTGGDEFTKRSKEIQALIARFLPRKEA